MENNEMKNNDLEIREMFIKVLKHGKTAFVMLGILLIALGFFLGVLTTETTLQKKWEKYHSGYVIGVKDNCQCNPRAAFPELTRAGIRCFFPRFFAF